ncbi:MAG: hypothetical protein ACXIVF_10595 [Rhizobiaceae bacterium]
MIIAACVAGIGLGAIASLAQTGEAEVSALDRMTTGTIPNSERFSFYVNGQSAECALERFGDDLMRAIGTQCRDLPHGLAEVTDWIEADDGAVTLAGADGSVLVKLAVSDGAAYESFDPPSPLVLLAAQD